MMMMCFFHLELSIQKMSLWRILKGSLFQYYKYENWGREKYNFLKFTKKVRNEAKSRTQLMWKRSNATCNIKLAKVIKLSSIITQIIVQENSVIFTNLIISSGRITWMIVIIWLEFTYFICFTFLIWMFVYGHITLNAPDLIWMLKM